MQETHETAAAARQDAELRRHPGRAMAAAAALAGLAAAGAAGAATLSPIFAGMSLNHNETLVRSSNRQRPDSSDHTT